MRIGPPLPRLAPSATSSRFKVAAAGFRTAERAMDDVRRGSVEKVVLPLEVRTVRVQPEHPLRD